MKPVIREYDNEQILMNDIKDLKGSGVYRKDIYLLSSDNSRTKRLAKQADVNTIGLEELGFNGTLGNLLNDKNNELIKKMIEVGLSKEETKTYKEKLNQGKVLLIINDHKEVRNLHP
ncbi:general stress protein [Scopulibacillus cellulosilyticus]|uniref:General stress protein n=1 Tax=Scopulibacillus cellulosilyticus TaxID=2665665 RepID=A0ABW2Q318_9BACL